jgi:hypothetical protein
MARAWLLAGLLLSLSPSARADSPDLGASPPPAPDAGIADPANGISSAPPTPERYSSEWIEKTLRDYHERFPKLTRLVKLGTSVEGRPMWGLAIGRHLKRGDKRPAMLLNGAHHGIEFLSIEMVMDAIEVLLRSSAQKDPDPTLRRDPQLDKQVRRFLEELVIWCVPVVNPDGVWASLRGSGVRTGRKNGRDTDGNGRIDAMDGVDLNRNYPFRWGFLGEVGSSSNPKSYYFRGSAPGSEPETQAMMRLAPSATTPAASPCWPPTPSTTSPIRPPTKPGWSVSTSSPGCRRIRRASRFRCVASSTLSTERIRTTIARSSARWRCSSKGRAATPKTRPSAWPSCTPCGRAGCACFRDFSTDRRSR